MPIFIYLSNYRMLPVEEFPPSSLFLLQSCLTGVKDLHSHDNNVTLTTI